jgi:molecular chaperone GrpE
MSEPTPPPENTAAPGAEVASDEDKSLDRLLAEAHAKIEEQRNAWLRALADADNARKRAQAEIAQARKFAVERFVEDLLPVMDSLEAALATATPSAGDAPLRSGVELTLKLLRTALERAGVSEIAPAPGERFDPHRHQAMAAAESDAEPNTVVNVMQKGYLLNDRVVRAALVTVAKPRPANDPAQS